MNDDVTAEETGTRSSTESPPFRGTLRMEMGENLVAELAIDDQGVSVMHAAAGMKATWIEEGGKIAGWVQAQDAFRAMRDRG